MKSVKLLLFCLVISLFFAGQVIAGIPTLPNLVFDSTTIDDDNLGNSSGNNNGLIDAGETIELFVSLLNDGGETALNPFGTLSTIDPYITFLFNTDSSYPNIPPGGVEANTNDFDFFVDSLTPNGHEILFDLFVTADEVNGLVGTQQVNGLDWTIRFSLPVFNTTPIPEPSTMLLLGGGLLGLVLFRRKFGK